MADIQENALGTVSGTTSSDFFRVVTSGGASKNVSAAEVKCLVLTSASFSSLPQTITNANITSSHVVINSVLSNPAAQTGDWTVTTSNGSLTIAGSISGSTTLTLYLLKQA